MSGTGARVPRMSGTGTPARMPLSGTHALAHAPVRHACARMRTARMRMPPARGDGRRRSALGTPSARNAAQSENPGPPRKGTGALLLRLPGCGYSRTVTAATRLPPAVERMRMRRLADGGGAPLAEVQLKVPPTTGTPLTRTGAAVVEPL